MKHFILPALLLAVLPLGGCTGLGFDATFSGSPFVVRPLTKGAAGVTCPGTPAQSSGSVRGEERYEERSNRRPDAWARYRVSRYCGYRPQ